jgi:predicted DNA-binding transcriptional regulator YafY
MLETSARLLRLLSLLQTPGDWTGADLAQRLEVDVRTVRRDIQKLRDLGYPVHATPGAAGYRLGAGTKLPPLLLDDEEAVAVAIGLGTAASGTVTGIEETSLRALAKLEQVLPSRVRHRVNLLHSVTVSLPATGPAVDPAVLTAVAAACREHQRLRFDYHSHDGANSVRDTEPHRLVHTGRRWYLIGWDTDRRDWRTYRVDRIRPRIPAGPRFTPPTSTSPATSPTASPPRRTATRLRSPCTRQPRPPPNVSHPPSASSKPSTPKPASCTPDPTPSTKSPSTSHCSASASRSTNHPN